MPTQSLTPLKATADRKLNAMHLRQMLTQSLTPLKANAHTELNATEGKCSHRAQRHLRQTLTQSLTPLKAIQRSHRAQRH